MAPLNTNIIFSWRWLNAHSNHMLWKANTKHGFPWSDTLLHKFRGLDGKHHVTLRTSQSWEDCNVHYMCTKDTKYDVLKIHLWCHYRFSSSTEQSTSSRLMRRHRRRRRKPKAPRMERVRLLWLINIVFVPSYQCLTIVSLSVSSSLALFLSISPVLIVQQHNWLHHVSEHHNCHIKHGWVCAHVYLCVCRWTCTTLLKTTWMTFSNFSNEM